MKHTKKALLLASLLAGSMFTAQAEVINTKHNLGTGGGQGTAALSGAGTNYLATGTGEVCVFCHTPHGADSSASVPLWNRDLPLASGFTTYDTLGTSSLDGGVAEVGSVSIACLSCHDGAQAMDVLINQPGSGGYDAGGAAPAVANTWNGVPTIAVGITRIGTDLTDDHPIGIQYAGGGWIGGGGASTDADFNDPDEITVNALPVWFIDTNANSTREKVDLPLYTRGSESFANKTDSVINEPYVECATCHDPHTDDNPTFLRISNVGSAVCLACHIK